MITLAAAVHGETIIVDASQAAQVLNNTNNTESTKLNPTTIADLITTLEDLKSIRQEREYLEALNNRSDSIERKFSQLVTSQDRTIRKQTSLIEEQVATITDLKDQITNNNEQLSTKIAAMEQELQGQKYYKYIYMVVAMIFTIFAMEYINAITKRKKMFFKLRNIRDKFPINLSIIGRGKKE